MEEKQISTGEAAKISGLTIRTLQHYAAPCAFFVKVLAACQPAKAHHIDVLLRNGKKRRAVSPPVLSCFQWERVSVVMPP